MAFAVRSLRIVLVKSSVSASENVVDLLSVKNWEANSPSKLNISATKLMNGEAVEVLRRAPVENAASSCSETAGGCWGECS